MTIFIKKNKGIYDVFVLKNNEIVHELSKRNCKDFFSAMEYAEKIANENKKEIKNIYYDLPKDIYHSFEQIAATI